MLKWGKKSEKVDDNTTSTEPEGGVKFYVEGESYSDHTADVVRRIMGSWRYIDLKDEDLDEADKKARDRAIAGVYKVHLRPMLDYLMKQQVEYAVKQSADWQQVLFNRGTINGFDLLLQKLEEAHQRHSENTQPKEEFDKDNLFPEV